MASQGIMTDLTDRDAIHGHLWNKQQVETCVSEQAQIKV